MECDKVFEAEKSRKCRSQGRCLATNNTTSRALLILLPHCHDNAHPNRNHRSTLPVPQYQGRQVFR
jgi:hypothetical protein